MTNIGQIKSYDEYLGKYFPERAYMERLLSGRPVPGSNEDANPFTDLKEMIQACIVDQTRSGDVCNHEEE